MQLYQKIADSSPYPALRSYCVWVRAQTSLKIAWYQSEKGDYAAVASTLRNALPFAWRYPRWWWGAIKRVARPIMPRWLVLALRRWRGGPASV